MLWLVLYADDSRPSAQGPLFEMSLIVHLFLFAALGTSLTWAKVKGGVKLEWVGYLLDLGRFEMGISELRAQWCITWLTDKVQ